MIKNLVFFAVGAAAGFGVSYFIFKKQADEKAQADVEEIKKEYARRAAEKETESDGEEEEEPEDRTFHIPEKPDILEVRNKKVTSYNTYSEKAERASRERKNRKYDNKSAWEDEYEEDDFDEDDEDDEVDQSYDHPQEGNAEEPYSISPEQFARENLHFDKETLFYYGSDGVLATEDDEQVTSEISNTVGRDFLKNFDGSDETAYIRNEKTATDYEVIMLKGSFYDKFIKEG